MEQIRNTLLKYLTIPILLLSAACLCILSWHISAPHDIWWQMANGRLIANTCRLVSTDSYTFTITGNTYNDKYWLYEILTYTLHKNFGWPGLAYLRMLLVLTAFTSLSSNIKKSPLWLLFLTAIPALILIDLRIMLRAYWFTLILLPVFLRLTTKIFSENDYSPRNIGLLCAIGVAWTNLHGEFFWGWACAGIFFADNIIRSIRRKTQSSQLIKAGSCLMLLLLSSLINPLGLNLITGLITEARLVAVHTSSTEWMPFAFVAQPLTWSAWIMLFLLTSFSIRQSGRRLSIPLLTIFIAFALLSQYSMRFIGIFTVASVFIAMEHGQHIKIHKTSEKIAAGLAPVLNILACLTIIWTVSLGWFYNWQAEQKMFGCGIITSEFPVKSSEFLKNNNIKGNFINSWTHGGYLIWHNWPGILIAEDGRTSPFPAQLSSCLKAVSDGDEKAFSAFTKDYAPDGAIVPWQYTGMLSMLSARPDWHLLFAGPNSSVWMNTQSLTNQNKQHLAVNTEQMEKFIVPDAETSWKQEPYLSYWEHSNRMAVFFASIGRKDLADKQWALTNKPLTKSITIP